MEYDLHSNVLQKIAMEMMTISTNDTFAGEIIDTFGFESVEFMPLSRNLSDGNYSFFVEHGDAPNLSDAELVPDEFVIGPLPVYDDTDDTVTKRVGVLGKGRYVRLSVTSKNVVTSATFVALALLGNPHVKPTAEL